jgi:hypothetical protein
LRPAQASGDDAANQNIIEWQGGSIDDLVAFFSGPALAVRVEVLPAKGDTPLGEVHMLAGGVSEALYEGKSTDDALDKLRAVGVPRFRIEPRLPNPADGDLASPGPDSGTLDARPLAHLMRYCEQYVITCGIEVWRGSETARVEYRKGEIGSVTVGGIDAPERLAEVMQWASGNYRLMIPRLTMPEVIPKAVKAAPLPPAPPPAQAWAPTAAPARPPGTPAAARPPATPAAARPAAPAPAAAAPHAPPPQAPAAPARAPLSSHATRTIFGMPALDLAGLKAAETAAAIAKQAAVGSAPQAPLAAATAAPVVSTVPAHAAVPISATTQSAHSATKTIFGVPAPKVPDKTAGKAPEEAARAAAAAAAPPSAESTPQRVERKTGARKTIVPAPAILPPAGSPEAAADAAAAAAAETSRTTHSGYDGGPATAPEPIVAAKVPATDDRTAPVRVATAKKSGGIPVWTYVGVGFLFGLALLGIYQLVGVLAH